jgi:hypothetical protein
MTREAAAKAVGASAVIDRRVMVFLPGFASETLLVEAIMSSRHRHGNACANASHPAHDDG